MDSVYPRYVPAIAVVNVSMYVLQPFIAMLFYALGPMDEPLSLEPIADVQFYIDPSKYYIPIYLLSASSIIFTTLIYLALDAYFVMTVHHACGMYAVLR